MFLAKLPTCQSCMWWLNDFQMIFLNEIFYILMSKCIRKPIHHKQTLKYPKHSPMSLIASLLSIITEACKLAQHLEKPLTGTFDLCTIIRKLTSIVNFWCLLSTLAPQDIRAPNSCQLNWDFPTKISHWVTYLCIHLGCLVVDFHTNHWVCASNVHLG